MKIDSLDVKNLPNYAEDIFTLNVSDYMVPEAEQKKREELCRKMGNSLVEDIKNHKKDFYKFNKIIEFPESFTFNSNPNWYRRPYGAVSTVGQRATLAFVAKLLINNLGYNYISQDSIFKEIETKHYRLWKLFYREKTLCMPEATIEGLKAAFPEDEKIQKCTSLFEIFHVAGKPTGIGESPFFIDNLIYSICSNRDIPISFYDDKRIPEAGQILENLEIGCPVPLRVSTEIYLGDPRPQEDYYVTLYGLDGEKAYVMDSKKDYISGVRKISIDQLLEAITYEPNSACAWDLYPFFNPEEFIYSS